MQYDISQPVDVLVNAINDLSKVAKYASSPMIPHQLIDLAYIIFTKHPILQQVLRLWSRKPLDDCTWPNMLTPFPEAQTDLSTIPTAHDLYPQNPVHHANTVTTMTTLVAQRILDTFPPNNKPFPPFPQPESINTAIQQRKKSLVAHKTALSNQLQELMTLMCTSTVTATPNNNNNNNNNPCGGRGRGRNNNCITSITNNHTVPSSCQYCWSHGACTHPGVNCNTHQPGHQETATFNNMMVGSTRN